MLKLAADENFHGDIVRGLLQRLPALNIVRVQDDGMTGNRDPQILEWAAAAGRILLTHDRKTVPDYAHERVGANLPMPGVFLVSDQMPIGQAVEEIALAVQCLAEEECANLVRYFPL